MDFNFSEEQIQLADAVGRWVEKAYPFERRLEISRNGGFSEEAYQSLAELGLCGLLTSDAYDGMDQGPVEAMVVMEQLGAGLVIEPIAQTWIASALIQAFGSETLKSDWLPSLAGGTQRIAVALNERAGRYRWQVCETHANNDQLTGHKHVVLGGADANAYLVSAMHNGQLALYLVANGAAGLRAEPYATQDGGRAVDLYLKDTPAMLVTADGLTAGAAAEAMGIAWLCAEGVGIMERMLAITVDYMNTRQQFGKTIASFQALRHRVADVQMALELARSMSYYATLKLNAVPEERDQAMARAKVQLGQSMRLVGQACIQLHGGIGVTDEVAISHYFKRLTQMEMQCGDTLHHLGRVSDQMQATAGVFA